MGQQLKNELKQIFLDVESSANTAEQKAELIAEAIVSKIKITIPPGSVVISATGGVPNPSPIECNVESR
jgi:hypothetical protein